MTTDGKRRIVLVTGMSGAGLSTATKVLEDLGYEAVDNLPLGLVGALVDQTADVGRPLAIVVDSRNRAFSAEALVATTAVLSRDPGLDVRLLMLDASDEVLQRRFTETRRRHPLAIDRPVADGIAHERAMLAVLRDHATQVIDTSDLTMPDFRRLVQGHFRLDAARGLSVFVQSFSFKLGLPREADLVFDVRFLRNPHYDDVLRPMTGRDAAVAAHVAADPDFDGFWERLTALLGPLLPRYAQEGKSYLTIAVGCTGGRHRSVYVTERLGAWLTARGIEVGVAHRDLERQGVRPG